VDLGALLKSHRASGAVATVVVDCEPGRNGNPALQVPTGIYVFERRALDMVSPHGFYDIKENLIPQLYRQRETVVTHRASGTIPRVLGAPTYLAVNEWMVEQLATEGRPPAGYVRSGGSLIHADASIAKDAVLVGPVLIGPDVRVMSGAVIVGPTSIGREVTIEPRGVVFRSAVWRRSLVGEQATADRSILADDSSIEPHARVCRQVLVADPARQPQPVQAARGRLDLREAGSIELRRLIAATLSRSAAVR